QSVPLGGQKREGLCRGRGRHVRTKKFKRISNWKPSNVHNQTRRLHFSASHEDATVSSALVQIFGILLAQRLERSFIGRASSQEALRWARKGVTLHQATSAL